MAGKSLEVIFSFSKTRVGKRVLLFVCACTSELGILFRGACPPPPNHAAAQQQHTHGSGRRCGVSSAKHGEVLFFFSCIFPLRCAACLPLTVCRTCVVEQQLVVFFWHVQEDVMHGVCANPHKLPPTHDFVINFINFLLLL